MRRAANKALLIVALVIAAFLAVGRASRFGSTENGPISEGGGQSIVTAIENRASKVQVEGEGAVIKVLADDVEGDRHQRFLLRLRAGQTLLVAHNIDLAPRIEGLRKGDRVEFSGEYAWNEKGGVVHWTHRDPRGRHVGGWLKHAGRTYQ